MQHEALRLAEAKAWFARVAKDLRSAEVGLSVEPPMLEDVLFHCQQAAEKALKGFLTFHDRPFAKTHDLRDLGKQCSEVDPTLEQLLIETARLTKYAWKFRYPGEDVDPSREEAEESLKLSQQVVEAVLIRLPQETGA